MAFDYQLLYDPQRGPMHVVAFASGSGTNFREAVLESREPGRNFSIDLLITDKQYKKPKPGKENEEREEIGAIKYARDFGVQHRVISGFQKCGSWAEAQKSVAGIREYERRCIGFNAELLGEMQAYEKEADIVFDFAVLAGYMRLFMGPLLRRFANRAINMHPARLDVFSDIGIRRYIGENAVFDALKDGEDATRSSMILVDPQTDGGAILASGLWVPYEGERPVTQIQADDHQERQKKVSDWPTERFTLREIANGNFALSTRKFHSDGNPVILYKDEEMPYCGVDLEDMQ